MSCWWPCRLNADNVGTQQSTVQRMAEKKNKMNSKRASHQSFIVADSPASKSPWAILSSRKSFLKIAQRKQGSVKTTQNLLVALSKPSALQALFNGRSMKTGFRAVGFPTVLITLTAVILTRKTPKKCFPKKHKIRNVRNKLNIRNTSSWRAKQHVRHHVT